MELGWRPSSRGDRAVALAWAAAVAAFVGSSHAWGPILGSLAPCALQTTLGLPCSACGGTRAVEAVLRGRLLEALSLNPLTALVTVAFVAGGCLGPAWLLCGGSVPRVTIRRARALVVLLVGALLGNWLYVLWRHGPPLWPVSP